MSNVNVETQRINSNLFESKCCSVLCKRSTLTQHFYTNRIFSHSLLLLLNVRVCVLFSIKHPLYSMPNLWLQRSIYPPESKVHFNWWMCFPVNFWVLKFQSWSHNSVLEIPSQLYSSQPWLLISHAWEDTITKQILKLGFLTYSYNWAYCFPIRSAMYRHSATIWNEPEKLWFKPNAGLGLSQWGMLAPWVIGVQIRESSISAFMQAQYLLWWTFSTVAIVLGQQVPGVSNSMHFNLSPIQLSSTDTNHNADPR